MEEHTLNNWEEFEKAIRDLENKRVERCQMSRLSVSELLYRGQANSQWLLETTLDRFFDREVSLREYYRIILAAKPQIETFTGAHWEVGTPDKYDEWLNKQESFLIGEFKYYDYFVYLRHHGFPSPLLDWTTSPYIAAFFAFDKVPKDVDWVSIFVFWEYPGGGKTAWGENPVINSLGPYVRSHKRHFLQQSQYTICTVKRKQDICYARHEDVLAVNNPRQDLLWKFNIHAGERKRIIKNLDRMNINPFSLFGTEDSLMEMIATKEIFLKGRDSRR